MFQKQLLAAASVNPLAANRLTRPCAQSCPACLTHPTMAPGKGETFHKVYHRCGYQDASGILQGPEARNRKEGARGLWLIPLHLKEKAPNSAAQATRSLLLTLALHVQKLGRRLLVDQNLANLAGQSQGFSRRKQSSSVHGVLNGLKGFVWSQRWACAFRGHPSWDGSSGKPKGRRPFSAPPYFDTCPIRTLHNGWPFQLPVKQ